MRWLRKQRDLIGLFLVWGILLQALALSFTTGLHAATLLSGSEASIICTSRGVAVTPDGSKQSNKGPDCQCCHMACRQACGGGCGGILPSFARVPLPSSKVIAFVTPRFDTDAAEQAKHATAQPRAPPRA
jgi:hypothetical protein